MTTETGAPLFSAFNGVFSGIPEIYPQTFAVYSEFSSHFIGPAFSRQYSKRTPFFSVH